MRVCARLGQFYARAALASGVAFDHLYGPAYKGITLAAATAIALAEMGHNVPYSYNRKEAKDHGEGGLIVGAALKGNVMIVDDVITDGGAKRESIELIRTHAAHPAGVLIAFDRQERGRGERSAIQELQAGIRRAGRRHRDARGSAGIPRLSARAGDAAQRRRALPRTVRRGGLKRRHAVILFANR